jgi:ATP-dependent protease ClpP protease subunit
MADVQIYLAGVVNNQTAPKLIEVVNERVGKGARSVLIAISSGGGNIFWGVTAYNFLRGLGIAVTTHNVGQVDSVAAVLYCAGDDRLSVPEGRFLIHGVSTSFNGTNPTLTEKDLRSTLASLEKDRDTIASILATRTGKPLDDVRGDMLKERILAADAQGYGFVTRITSDVFDPSQEIVQILLP